MTKLEEKIKETERLSGCTYNKAYNQFWTKEGSKFLSIDNEKITFGANWYDEEGSDEEIYISFEVLKRIIEIWEGDNE